MRHSVELFPALEGLLQQTGRRRQDISHCFISVGPGSFTGLRIAVSAAKAMHLANKTHIVTVNTLDVIAANADPGSDFVVPVIDAKRGQFFTASYQGSDDGDGQRQVLPDCLATPQEILARCAALGGSTALLGEGLLHHGELFSGEGITLLPSTHWTPKAARVYALGKAKAAREEYADPLTLTPYYLRAPQVTIKRA
jgi:tRNA threonylcarbamoyladenosine biosynthesis protein TsaB